VYAEYTTGLTYTGRTIGLTYTGRTTGSTYTGRTIGSTYTGRTIGCTTVGATTGTSYPLELYDLLSYVQDVATTATSANILCFSVFINVFILSQFFCNTENFSNNQKSSSTSYISKRKRDTRTNSKY
jgi:hypothetical protein